MARIIVISTGNELLYGTKVNTNAGVISFSLRRAGLDVNAHVTVGDDRISITTAVREFLHGADAVIMTGGLGPTDDDLTVESLRDIFNYNTVVHEASMIKMRSFFGTIGKSVSDADIKMVLVPDNAIIIENRRGFAPGFILQHGGCSLIALPGVPHEMEDMLHASVIPFLLKNYGRDERESVLLTLVGLKESEINESIGTLRLDADKVTWGMTAEGGITRLYFSRKKNDGCDFDEMVRTCRRLFGEALLGKGFTEPEEELLQLLISKKYTISTAESCTGGLIAKRLTDVPGSSLAFKGGVVAYSNDVKESILAVPGESLLRHGAVSEEVAASMARGARNAMGSDIAVSTTGIAGPGGGSERKPVGMVCFGLDILGNITTWTRTLAGEREWIRRVSSIAAIDMVRRILLRENGIS